MLKRTLLGVLVAGTLSACGTLPGATNLGAADDATTTATRNFYAVMGLSDAAPADATASAGAPAAGNQASGEARMKDRFAKLDANGDGQVTYEEFVAAAPGARQGVSDAGAVFDRIDDDASEGIGHDEFRAGSDRKGRPGPGEMKRGGKRGHGEGRGRRHGRGGQHPERPHHDAPEAPSPAPSEPVPVSPAPVEPAPALPVPDAPATDLPAVQG